MAPRLLSWFPRRRTALSAMLAAVLCAALVPGVGRATPGAADASTAPRVIPALTDWTAAGGSYRFDQRSRILVPPGEPQLAKTARTLGSELETRYGDSVPVVRSTNAARDGDVVLRFDRSRDELKHQGYALHVGDTVRITGAASDGVFYGTRTLLQLLDQSRSIPRGEAVDVPRYPERGLTFGFPALHLSTAWLERLFADMAYLKLNYVLLEAQIQSSTHPEAVRWGYYTKNQVRQVTALADKYHIDVIPEVNGPGHMDFYLFDHPELQLVDKNGNRSPGQLDITKPEAFDFYTDLIDEWSKAFDSQYWMVGADEYLGYGDDYSDFPQLAKYAKEKFGPDALPQDVFIDFVNRVDEYVRGKGLTLRMWNDGIPAKSTVKLNTDIVVEHWIDDKVTPSELIVAGHKVMNASERLYYDYGRGFHGDFRKLWDNGWNPGWFSGQQVDPDNPAITGAKISVWPVAPAAVTERQLARDLFTPLRFLAQRSWGTSEPFIGWDDFVERARTLGHPPGWANADYRPVTDGAYTIGVKGGDGLAPSRAEVGSTLVTKDAASEWQVRHTADGYYRIVDADTGLCVDMRRGRHWVTAPIEPGAAATVETCDGRNTQKWQVVENAHGPGYTLTNAISQLVLGVAHDGSVVQMLPQKATGASWRLHLAAPATMDVKVKGGVLVAGYASTVNATFTNNGDEPATDLTVSLRTPDGWRVERMSDAPTSAVAPGESVTVRWTVTPPDDTAPGRYRLSATAAYTIAGTGREREVTGTAAARVVQGRVVTTPYYRMVLQTAPETAIESLGVDPAGDGDYRKVLDADSRATAPYLAVGRFGDTDRPGPAETVRVSDDGQQVSLRGIPMGDEPVTVDWSFAFSEQTFQFSLDWHVTGPLNAPAWEVAWSWDTALPHIGDPGNLDRGTGDVSGLPHWTIAYDENVSVVAAYKDGSAFAQDNHWFNPPAGMVAWQPLWQPGGRDLAAGDHEGGTWRIGASGKPKDAAFADRLYEELNQAS